MTETYQHLCDKCGHTRIEPLITYCKCSAWYTKEIDDAIKEIKERYGTKERMLKYLSSHKSSNKD